MAKSMVSPMVIMPQLPPLFEAILLEKTNAFDGASAAALNGSAEAGQVYFCNHKNKVELALVLEPDVAKNQSNQMLHVMMVAIGDALGAILPPEIGIQYRWPNGLLANGARFGSLYLKTFGEDEIPDYLILGVKFTLRDDIEDIDPGLYEGTTLWDEGSGDLDGIKIIESLCRHFQVQLNTWQEDGFQPIHQAWSGRYDENPALLLEGDVEASFIGLDEMGNGLLKIGKDTILQTIDELRLIQDD